jgi:hypothetical protein
MELRNNVELRVWPLLADLELEGGWRVEYFDSDGAEYIAIFAGQSAEVRARDYYDALERGTLDTRIRHTKESRLFPTETKTASSLRGRRFRLVSLARFGLRTRACASWGITRNLKV